MNRSVDRNYWFWNLSTPDPYFLLSVEQLMLLCPFCGCKLSGSNQEHDDSRGSIFSCRLCSYSFDVADGVIREDFCGHSGQTTRRDQRRHPLSSTSDAVLGDASSEGQTCQIICEKCGADRASYYQMQTRSADEGMTTFYTCTKCRYTWREQ